MTVIATGFNPESITRRAAAVVETIVPVDPPPVEEVLQAEPSEATQTDDRVSALMNDLTEAMDESPVVPDPEWTETKVDGPELVVGQEQGAGQVGESSEGFLVRAAAGGGPDVDLSSHTVPLAESDHPSAAVTEETTQPFLRPVGTRSIGEVETPAWPAKPAAVNRSVAAGIGPDNPKDDLTAPAYTRKYMD